MLLLETHRSTLRELRHTLFPMRVEPVRDVQCHLHVERVSRSIPPPLRLQNPPALIDVPRQYRLVLACLLLGAGNDIPHRPGRASPKALSASTSQCSLSNTSAAGGSPYP